MISFEKLGKHEGVGNQLFQYAFLRATAQRLGVEFYCPPWLGDKIFLLGDEAFRAKARGNMDKVYRQPDDNSGYSECALGIEDGTEIFGFFQSEKYFAPREVRRWYTFKEEAVSRVEEKYKEVDFTRVPAIHLRFGDMTHNPMFVILPAGYYVRALSVIKSDGPIWVFSDEIPTARKHLQGIRKNFVYIEGNKDYEDLYLMARCRNVICSVSTFSWWGAWLIPHRDKKVVAPREWIRPGHPMRNFGLNHEGWTILKTCRPVLDDYRFLMRKKLWEEKFLRMKARSLKENLLSFRNFLRKKKR